MPSVRNRQRKKERFLGIPYTVVKSNQWCKLGAKEVKFLLDLLTQYNGHNNGSLSPCYTLMKERGWAKSSLHRSFNKLQHSGFVVVTRQGWKKRGKATLVAITWLNIDDPKNDVEYDPGIVPHHSPLGYWCKAKSGWKHKPTVKDFGKCDSPNTVNKSTIYSPKLELVVGGNH